MRFPSGTESQEAFRKRGRQLLKNLEDLARSIGQVVIAFNGLERDVSDVLVTVLKLRKTPGMWDSFRASMSFAQRLDLICAVFLQADRTEAERSLLAYCMRKLRYYEERRNYVVHATWSTASFGDPNLQGKKVSTKGGKGLRASVQSADWVDLAVLAAEIDLFCSLDLVQLYGVCQGESTSWSSPLMEEFVPDLRDRVLRARVDGK